MEEKIRKTETKQPGTSWEITKVRNMYAPVIRRFDVWFPCVSCLTKHERSWRARGSSAYFAVRARREGDAGTAASLVLCDPQECDISGDPLNETALQIKITHR
jgi:hypothetical protein